MAQPTTEHHVSAPQQRPTRGVGMQGNAPATASTEPATPVLVEDIDPILLVKLYPGAESAEDLRTQAMAAGEATAAAGAETVASQQEPVVGAGGEPPPPTPPVARSGPGPSREPEPHRNREA